jgi:hypothetical protein
MALNLFSKLLLAFVAAASAASPSVQASISAQVVNDFLQQKLPKLLTSITNLDLGGFSDDFEFALIKGHITVDDVTLKHISFDPKTTEVTLASPNVISIQISDISLDLTSKTKLKYGLITDTYNNLEIKTSKASASLSAALRASDSGALQIDLKSFDLKLGDLDVQTHSMSGLFVKLGAKLFKPFITSAVKKAIVDEVPSLNKALASFSYNVIVPSTSTAIDLHLVAQPQVIKDLFYLIQLGSLSSSTLQELNPLDPTYDLQLQISQTVLSDLLQAVWPLVNVTVSELDGKSLTTDQVALFLPGLAKTFGSGQQLGVHVTVNSTYTPQLSFNPAAELLIQPDIEFLVNVNSTWQHAFTLHLLTNATASIGVTDSTLSAKISSLKFPSVSYSDSVIGTVNMNNIKFLLNEGVGIIIPLANSKLANLTLPLDDIPVYQVTSDELLEEQGAVGIGADLKLKD